MRYIYICTYFWLQKTALKNFILQRGPIEFLVNTNPPPPQLELLEVKLSI